MSDLKRLIADVGCSQVNCYGEPICGDNFIVRTLAGGRRTLVVLSDGMGHGVKANILATYTSTMLFNFIAGGNDMAEAAEAVARMLPVCKVRNISYSTFTVADIDNRSGEVTLLRYDNPPVYISRGAGRFDPQWSETVVSQPGIRDMKLHTATFTALPGDRIIMVTDGVTQSGQREGIYRFGWGDEGLAQFVDFTLHSIATIKSGDLASQVVSKARMNDGARPSDDITCIVVGLSRPRTVMLVSCPPSLKKFNGELLERVKDFPGEKVVCGYPVAKIISEGTGAELQRSDSFFDLLDGPSYKMGGFQMVTEGMVVPNRLLELLENGEGGGEGTAARLRDILLRHDEIEMVVGLRRNIDHGSGLPDEFELRRNVLRRIAALLREKYSKTVDITYL